MGVIFILWNGVESAGPRIRKEWETEGVPDGGRGAARFEWASGSSDRERNCHSQRAQFGKLTEVNQKTEARSVFFIFMIMNLTLENISSRC